MRQSKAFLHNRQSVGTGDIVDAVILALWICQKMLLFFRIAN